MPAANDSPCSSRALVAVESNVIDLQHYRRAPRPANFLAHLIATARQVPQAREKRRADASEVIAAYQATIAKLKKLNSQ